MRGLSRHGCNASVTMNRIATMVLGWPYWECGPGNRLQCNKGRHAMRKKLDVTPPEQLTYRALDIIEQKRKYELITPLYGGGVTTNEDDPTITNRTDPITVIRATEIRGQLRFWWRAMRGAQSENDSDLKKREDALWGKAYEKGDKGISSDQTVQIVVDIVQEGTL